MTQQTNTDAPWRRFRDVNMRLQRAWERWKVARVGGKVAAMEKEKARIIGLRTEAGNESRGNRSKKAQ